MASLLDWILSTDGHSSSSSSSSRDTDSSRDETRSSEKISNNTATHSNADNGNNTATHSTTDNGNNTATHSTTAKRTNNTARRNTRATYLFLGLALRVTLLLYGLWQDQHSPTLPYTDVDYSVFVDGARSLVHGCPLHAISLDEAQSEPWETIEEFRSPTAAPINGCAQGWLAIGARYILQHENILLARSGGHHSAEKARQSLGDEVSFSLMEPNWVETTLIPISLAILKPILKPLATMGSPYARPTYRYTPLLALLLAPGAHVGGTFEKLWGKILFLIADVAAALLMWDIARFLGSSSSSSKASSKQGKASTKGHSKFRRFFSYLSSDYTHTVGLLWLLNPFPAQIATRGSSESILVVLILGFVSGAVRLLDEGDVRLVEAEGQLEGVVEPIDDRAESKARAAATMTATNGSRNEAVNAETEKEDDANSIQATQGPLPPPLADPGRYIPLPALPYHYLAAPFLLSVSAHLKLFPAFFGFPVLVSLLHRQRYVDALAFTGSSVYAFLVLTLTTWAIWGDAYLSESILYHFTRIDHRHNFSPYFLPLYLLHTPSTPTGDLPSLPLAAQSPLMSFLPQVGLTLFLCYRFSSLSSTNSRPTMSSSSSSSSSSSDLIMALGSSTMAFVTLNKVQTSQYILWYLPFLPLLLPSLSFPSMFTPIVLLVTWVGIQALWLSQAYLLEVQGRDVLVQVWAAGLVYVLGMAAVLGGVIRAWNRGRKARIAPPTAAGAAAVAAIPPVKGEKMQDKEDKKEKEEKEKESEVAVIPTTSAPPTTTPTTTSTTALESKSSQEGQVNGGGDGIDGLRERRPLVTSTGSDSAG